ncbi:hypothetical protein ZYGR_0AD05300 [Zygosaccharomyces rouxii]|uniref:ZYRO0G18260p n=2 Tax=Zygosaccharomyces rouxii TaxID=4956 RepID=C5E158_ZYGRC|nr:uncharacterized protein ZYRO0G18260g [Zygosaccharomyces rouxii]KAH9202835.1 hypothetical protein LQ764DRAFT_222946 [Zygosaccharomyces rouxii]GAV51347.1 hypothetical protein ZYGR_0AD05300 [Zygosaccharomyces rouxii]CAR29842.1 ZYRO0G18260p [Zygosaccharomyces rouxii]
MLPMQNTVRTPKNKTTFDKKVHTPPSVEQDARKSKLLKNLSGKVFRRASLKSQQSTTLDSIELFNNVGNSMSMKRSTPKPLNLSQPLTPPPSVKGQKKELQQQRHQKDTFRLSTSSSSGSIKTAKLDSPIHLFSPLRPKSSKSNGIKPINLRNSLRSASTSSSIRSHPIIWTETVEDPYLEEDSPTYLCSISKNISNVSSSAGRRRFVSEQCSMCAEGMNSIFPGETVVQMTCSHASHYECYLAMYESHYREGKWPQCRTCHKVSKPVDEDVIHKMTSSLLTRRESTSSIIEQHLMNARLSDSASSAVFDFTPRDQLITSADISSDGFKTPLRIPRVTTNYENDDTELSYENLFGSGIPTSDSNTASVVVEESRRVSDSNSDCDGDDQLDLKIEINPLLNNHYSITAQLPRDKHGKNCCKANPKRNQHILQEKNILILQVESFVKREVDPKDEFGSLSIFDQISYSTDGERWDENTLVCFFEKCLILFDLFEMKTIGKIPIEQVCHVNRLSETTLIIDLKNRTLPEIYFAFPPHLRNHKSVLEKWKYYLMQPGREPELEFMSDTAWEIFPEDMAPALMGIVGDNKRFVCNQCAKPWENGTQEVPLQLIVCLSLCQRREEDGAQYRQRIIGGLHKMLESLNDRDLLGVVTVGRNGSGEIGEFGSFVGTVSKNWSGWKEYIDELETVDGPCFQTPLKEFNRVWETCYRLVSTSSSLLEGEDQNQFSKQIVLMTDDARIQRQGGKNKFEEIIKNHYGFDVTRIPPSTSTLSLCENISSTVTNLHQKRFKDLEVTLQGNVIFKFGNMAPGEKKTLYSEHQKNSMRLAARGNNANCVRIPYHAQWFNLRTSAEEKIHRFASYNSRSS